MAIGSVSVEVVPSAEGFWREFEAKTKGGAEPAGRAAGSDWSRGFEREVDVDPLKRTGQQQKEKSRQQGAAAGDAFGRSFDQRVTAAMRALPELKPGVDNTGADRKLAELRNSLKRMIDPEVRVKMSDAQALARLHAFEAELRALTTKSHDVRIRINATAAAKELAGVQADIDKALKAEKGTDDGPDTSKSTDKAKESAQGLLKAILPLAPALVPLAGAAAAGGVAFAAMGATAIAAFKGAQAAIKDGTTDGLKFARGVGQMKAALGSLEATASHGVLTGFQRSVATVTSALPGLNTQAAAVSQQLGSIGSHLLGGILGGFANFGPVIQQVLTYVDQLAGKFEAWAGGAGGAGFAKALGIDFESALPVLQNLAVAAAHLFEAMNSQGQGSLGFLTMFSGVIAHIPVDIIKAGTTAYLAFRAAVTVTAGLTAASAALKGFAVSEAAAATAGGALAARTAGGMAAVIGRATPYIGALIAADFALRSLVKTNNAWSQSNNKAKQVLGQEGAAFSALARGQNPFKAMSANADARRFANALQPVVETYQRIREENLKFGKEMLYTSAEPYAAKNLKVIARNATLLSTALRGSSVNLSTAGRSINEYSTVLANAAAGEQKWLTQGKDSGKVIAGVAVYTGTWAAAVKEAGGNTAVAADVLAAHADALRDDQAAAAKAATEAKRLSDAVSTTAAKYHLSAEQVSTYGTALGISAQQVASGEITTRQFTRAVGAVARAFANGNDAVQGWLSSLSQIDLTQNTLATRVQVLGAGLKALQGVTLDMAGTNLQAASSLEQAAGAITKHRHVFSDQGELLGQLTKTTHGYVIEQPKLTQNALAVEQAMSQAGSSAITLAQNIYQNTGSAKKASDAYYGLRAQFIKTLDPMGKFPGKAKKIADSIYGIPNNKFVSFLQKGDLPSAIRTLSSALGDFTRKFDKILVFLGINDHASKPLHDIFNDIDALHDKTVTITVGLNNDAGALVHDAVNNIPGSAAGSASWTPDGKLPPGLSTVGERGWELVSTDARGRSQVFSHAQSVAMTGMPKTLPGFAAGTAANNAAQVSAALRSAFHFTRAQIAGFLGNFQVESHMNPKAYNRGENAHGIAQWEGPRWTALQQYARHMGVQATSMAAQTGFLVKELRGSGLVPQIKKMKDPTRVAAFVDAHYERSAGTSRPQREAAARAFARSGFKAAGGAAGAAAGAAGSGSSTSRHRRASADVGPITTGTLDGKDVWVFGGKKYSSLRAAQNARAAAITKMEKAGADRVKGALGAVGQPATRAFDINQVGYTRIRRQLAHVRVLLDNADLTPAARASLTKQYRAALRLAHRELGELRLKIKTTDLKAFQASIGQSADVMRAAFTVLATDLKNAGASAQNVSRLRKRETKIVSANTKYTNARDYSAGIKSTLAGTFDPTQFGSTTDLIAGLSGQTSQNNAYAKELSKLHGETKHMPKAQRKQMDAFINQLAASGQTATLQSLASASKGDLTNVSKSLGAYNASLTKGADAATTEKYGNTAGEFKKTVEHLVTEERAWIADVLRATAHGMGQMAHAVNDNHHHTKAQTRHEIDNAMKKMTAATRHGRKPHP